MLIKTNHYQRWHQWLLALAILLPGLGVSAPRVDFGHFAAGAPAVIVEVDGVKVTDSLAYRGYHKRLQLNSGTRQLRARNAEGATVAQLSLQLDEHDSVVVFLAGEGSSELPYELLTTRDHNYPIYQGTISLQTSSLAIRRDAAGQLQPLRMGVQCADLPLGWSEIRFGSGTDGTANGLVRANNSVGSSSVRDCTEFLAGREGAEPASFARPYVEGLRLRRILSGNGQEHPWVIDFIDQAIETPVPDVAPTAAINGLWFDPHNPGTGLLLAHAPTQQEPNRIKAIIYGFGPTGQSSWRVLDGKEIVRIFGGSPSGTASVVSVATTSAEIRFHSCDQATLRGAARLSSAFTALPAGPFPRDAITLRKLLPAGCNTPGVG